MTNIQSELFNHFENPYTIQYNLSTKISELNLSVRSSKCLRKKNIIYVGDLVQKKANELLKLPNFGRKCLAEVEEKINSFGLHLGMDSFNDKIIAEKSSAVASEKQDHDIYFKSGGINFDSPKFLLRIEDLNLSYRADNCLKKEGIKYVGDLVQKNRKELLQLKNFGRRCLQEIEKKLSLMGLKLGVIIKQWSREYIREKENVLKKGIKKERLLLAKNLVQCNGETEKKKNLDAELIYLASAVQNDRDKEIVMKYYGWYGQEPTTLQNVANKYNITRERVRQICKKVEKTWRLRTAYVPVLRQTIKFINDRLPVTAEELESEIVSQGFAKNILRIEGICTAATTIGMKVRFQVMKFGRDRIVLDKELIQSTKLAINLAKKSISRSGVSTIEDIASQVQEKIGYPKTSKLISLFLTHLKGFHWLDQSTGWFWLFPVSRNRLINQIKKILSVTDSIDISELRAGVSRSHRMGGFSPPRRVLLELCKQLDWCHVDGNKVYAKPPLNWEQEIDGNIEKTVCSIIKEHGPIISREELEKRCLAANMNRTSFYLYLRYSPIITRYAKGVYGLRGSKVLPVEVDALKPIRQFHKVVQDYGWTSDGNIWISFKLSGGIINSGVIHIPSAMRKFLHEEYKLRTAENVLMGTLKIREKACWGLGPLFRRRGVELNDYLVIIFNQTAKDAIAYIGDVELLEFFQEGIETYGRDQTSHYSEIEINTMKELPIEVVNLIAVGERKGFLTYDELDEVLPDITSNDLIDKIIMLLIGKNIDIIELNQG